MFTMSAFMSAQFGARLGLNSSSQSVEFSGISVNSDSKIGMHLGVFYEMALSDRISIRPAALYSMKGGKSDDTSLGANYLEIPVDLMYYITKGDTKFFLAAGPYLGFGLNLSGDGVEGSFKDNGFKSTDFGLNLGLGAEFMNKYVVGLSYGLGLSNISEPVDGFDVSSKNKNLSLYLGYKF